MTTKATDKHTTADTAAHSTRLDKAVSHCCNGFESAERDLEIAVRGLEEAQVVIRQAQEARADWFKRLECARLRQQAHKLTAKVEALEAGRTIDEHFELLRRERDGEEGCQ